MKKKIKELLRKYSGILVIFIVALVLYLSTLSISLDDWDSIQFAFGLRDFNVSKHQPHPHGYPVYIFTGKIFYFFVRDELLTLTFFSALSGASALVAFFLFVKEMFNKRILFMATIILGVTPLFWLNSLKAMSDMPALFFSLISTLFIYKFLRYKKSKFLLVASILSGITMGVRLHTFFILFPILIYSYLKKGIKSKSKTILFSILLFLAGILVWLIPMLLHEGINQYYETSKVQFTYRFTHPEVSIITKHISWDYLIHRSKDYFMFFLLGGYGILFDKLSVISTTFLLLMAVLFVVFIVRLKFKDQRLHFLSLATIPYMIMVYVLLTPTNPRYLLPIIALLSLIFAFATDKLGKYKYPIFLLFVILILIHSIPLAIKIHTQEAAPIQLIDFIKKNYQSNNTAIVITGWLAFNFRHFDYYKTNFTVIRRDTLSDEFFRDLKRRYDMVLVAGDISDENIKKDLRLINQFYRDERVHYKHHRQYLYEVLD